MPVPQPVTAPITTARNALIAVLQNEFEVEAFDVVADRLHGSLGKDGITKIGVSPQQEVPMSSDRNTLQFAMLVQFYGGWKPRIDPNQIVDPSIVETYAERFKRALRGSDPNQDNVWFFNLVDLTYPPDPTGNMTRWESRVTAYGPNSSSLPATG